MARTVRREGPVGVSSAAPVSNTFDGPGAFSVATRGAGGVTFDIDRPSKLVWTNTGGTMFAAKGSGVFISSSRSRGEVELEPGAYRDLQVRGAAWRIVIRPR